MTFDVEFPDLVADVARRRSPARPTRRGGVRCSRRTRSSAASATRASTTGACSATRPGRCSASSPTGGGASAAPTTTTTSCSTTWPPRTASTRSASSSWAISRRRGRPASRGCSAQIEQALDPTSDDPTKWALQPASNPLATPDGTATRAAEVGALPPPRTLRPQHCPHAQTPDALRLPRDRGPVRRLLPPAPDARPGPRPHLPVDARPVRRGESPTRRCGCCPRGPRSSSTHPIRTRCPTPGAASAAATRPTRRPSWPTRRTGDDRLRRPVAQPRRLDEVRCVRRRRRRRCVALAWLRRQREPLAQEQPEVLVRDAGPLRPAAPQLGRPPGRALRPGDAEHDASSRATSRSTRSWSTRTATRTPAPRRTCSSTISCAGIRVDVKH